jgi:hypothetical protein
VPPHVLLELGHQERKDQVLVPMVPCPLQSEGHPPICAHLPQDQVELFVLGLGQVS